MRTRSLELVRANTMLSDSCRANRLCFVRAGHCFASGRLSFVLGLHGTCEAVDVACSAALVACHSARRELQMTQCRGAVLAGVNMMFMPTTLDGYAAAGLTSPSGKAFVFDTRANGFVRGEGCGGAFLRAGSEEVALTSSSVRHYGRSASLTAPNGRAQQMLLTSLLNPAGILPSQLQCVEAAANASALGDAIESGAIAATVGRAASGADALHVGSIKANIGHTESASGVMGMSKLMSFVQQSRTMPNARLDVLATHVATAWAKEGYPVALPIQLTLVSSAVLQGAVNSFGLGGTIASVMLRGNNLPGAGKASRRQVVMRRRLFIWQDQPSLAVQLERDRRRCSLPSEVGSCLLNLADVLVVVSLVSGKHIDPDAPLMESGIDSLGAIELQNQLQEALGGSSEVSDTLMFNHPTARAIASFLHAVHGPGPTLTAEQELQPTRCMPCRDIQDPRRNLASGDLIVPDACHSDMPLNEILEELGQIALLDTFIDAGCVAQ